MDIEKIKKDSYKFPLGTRVRVAVNFEDFQFFNKKETGVVIRNDYGYLGITVAFDEPRVFEDDTVQYTFNFNPSSLKIISDTKTFSIEEAISIRKRLEPNGCEHEPNVAYCRICKKKEVCTKCGK